MATNNILLNLSSPERVRKANKPSFDRLDNPALPPKEIRKPHEAAHSFKQVFDKTATKTEAPRVQKAEEKRPAEKTSVAQSTVKQADVESPTESQETALPLSATAEKILADAPVIGEAGLDDLHLPIATTVATTIATIVVEDHDIDKDLVLSEALVGLEDNSDPALQLWGIPTEALAGVNSDDLIDAQTNDMPAAADNTNDLIVSAPLMSSVANLEAELDQSTASEMPIRNEMPFSLLRQIKNTQQSVTETALDLPEESLNSTVSDGLNSIVDDVQSLDINHDNSELSGHSKTNVIQPLMAQFAQKGAENRVNTMTPLVDADTSGVTVTEVDEKVQTTTILETAPKNTAAIIDKPVVVSAHVRVGMPGWADQIAQRTASLVSQNIKQAEIQLNPQDMGPINIKISVSQDQAAVTFVAQNAQVREFLDQSMQRLREILAGDGFDLIQSDVKDQQQFANSQQGKDDDADAGIKAESEADDVAIKHVLVADSGIDHFV